MNTSMTTVISGGSTLSNTRGTSTATTSGGNLPNASTSSALFREIHKNTWLKRLTADGKKITVGPKKSERSWVVFCVHDDSKALLEGYAEPRQASSHNPEWIVSMQETQHISHALIPNSHEFEFVVTLHNEVVRFHAMSWEVMQEWVETLRSKLREMKILSPRENLYTKLPEIRAPLLPTRDPTSPLPAPPPVPAALVPGVERVMPHSVLRSADATTTTAPIAGTGRETEVVSAISTTNSSSANVAVTASLSNIPSNSHTPAISSMSNTLTQNLLNMLSDPIVAYSEQLIEAELAEETLFSDVASNTEVPSTSNKVFLHQMPPVTESNVITSLGQSENFNDLIIRGNVIPRLQTSRSLSAGAADNLGRPLAITLPSKHLNSSVNPDTKSNNVTELEISSALDESTIAPTTAPTTAVITSASTSAKTVSTANITIIQVTNNREKQQHQSSNSFNHKDLNKAADIFTFPEDAESTTGIQHNKKLDDYYKSNVQIIPSSLNSSTIQVVSGPTFAPGNQYSTPVKKNLTQTTTDSTPLNTSVAILSPRSHLENHQITTVNVGNTTTTTSAASVYGTCYTTTEAQQLGSSSTQVFPNKIVLSTNVSGVTNISVNSIKDNNECGSMVPKGSVIDKVVRHNLGSPRYERVFLSSSIPVTSVNERSEIGAGPSSAIQSSSRLPMSPKFKSALPQTEVTFSNKLESLNSLVATSLSLPSSPTPTAAFSAMAIKKRKAAQQNLNNSCNSGLQQQQRSLPQKITAVIQPEGSPAPQRKTRALNSSVKQAPQVPMGARFLTRGLTEAVITTRPSRRDFSSPKALVKPTLECNSSNTTSETTSTNNNEEAETSAGYELRQSQVEAAQVSNTRSNSLEHRKRSSSTSETQTHRIRTANNNEFISNRVGLNAIRMDQPPHPVSQPPLSQSAVKRLTLREQQVMQLRREILHPGGVRLQLRRKDCIGSIAWVEAFGAVWVAGWKQKEHPVLYNALHIGDQLISIAGVTTISSAADANKIIRNTNTLFVEVLIRRIPLGRGYAIRREREGQCLGLIRDGNTSTIVDVVPNSLAAKHGLTPKAKSCDGSTLTFWVLTEINGRPLNLFFKDNEIRDRLNSVGRDISILVQPADLIAKLKKQLKSLRGYKDYLVQ